MGTIRVLVTLAVLICSAAPLSAQAGAKEVRGGLGWSGFADEGTIDHLFTGVSAHYYLTRRFSVNGEFQYLRGSRGHYDLVLFPGVAFDLRQGRVTPYLVVNAGLLHFVEKFGSVKYSTNTAYASGGAGAKLYLHGNWFLAPEFRIGTEIDARLSFAIGYTWRR